MLRDDTPRIGLWLDTSRLTVEQTVDQILTRTAESAVTRGRMSTPDRPRRA